jgi:hypothetical protein
METKKQMPIFERDLVEIIESARARNDDAKDVVDIMIEWASALCYETCPEDWKTYIRYKLEDSIMGIEKCEEIDGKE